MSYDVLRCEKKEKFGVFVVDYTVGGLDGKTFRHACSILLHENFVNMVTSSWLEPDMTDEQIIAGMFKSFDGSPIAKHSRARIGIDWLGLALLCTYWHRQNMNDQQPSVDISVERLRKFAISFSRISERVAKAVDVELSKPSSG